MGLAVVGVFLERDAANSTGSNNLLGSLRGAAFAAANATHPFTLNLGSLVFQRIAKTANGEGFWQYDGSLTTPGCDEIVQWMVAKRKLKISVGRSVVRTIGRVVVSAKTEEVTARAGGTCPGHP